jgi:hypothetical protein
MNYRIRLFDVDGTEAHREAAERRFKEVLDQALGAAELVPAIHAAYLRIAAAYGDPPQWESLDDQQRFIAEQWLSAQEAALTAVWGPLRAMGDGLYELHIEQQ